jgi:sulfhydrogenase subunit beta (sulfur reductase)
MEKEPKYFFPHSNLQSLINALQKKGFRCIGPQVKDGAIIYDDLDSAEQLPWGIKDLQQPGTYRLEKNNEKLAFAWANGQQSIKPFLFKPYDTLWQAGKNNNQLTVECHKEESMPIAYIGAKACDLAALDIQDKIFLRDKYVDNNYKIRRENMFIAAVNCTHCSGNCFCASTGDGPKATKLFDIALTELENGFVTEIGTDKGSEILEPLRLNKASDSQINEAEKAIAQAAQQQSKHLPSGNLRDVLFANLDHERWDEVAARCLSCANCTSVCPTCFCHCSVEEPNLDGSSSTHKRAWDSCFTDGHSYIHGNLIRDDIRKRYRQWLTHKLGSWHDQFGTCGCVGCGRCITWCPAGIDITEEAAAICEPKKE